MNTFRKVVRYKINIQKPVTFLYSNNEQAEKEIRKTIQFFNKKWWENWVIHMQKTESRSFSLTWYRNHHKTDERP
jgi:hypothetical protein